MYKYKSWQNTAARPVASLDEEHSTITKPSPVHHPLPHPKPVTTFPTPSNVLLRTSSAQSIVPHRPQAGRELIPSSLCPHVAAVDRIRHWQTPHSHSFNSQVASYLPTNLVNSSFEMIYRSLAPAMRSTYGASLLRFTQFCDKYNISESDCMPGSFILLVAFISEHAGTVSGKTISGWLSGLKAWHDTNSAEWCGDKRWVQMARVTTKKEGTAFHKKCAILSLLTTSLPFTTVLIFLTLPMLPVGLLLPVPSGVFVDWANLLSPQYAPLTLPCMLHVPWRLCATPIEMPLLVPLSTFLGRRQPRKKALHLS